MEILTRQSREHSEAVMRAKTAHEPEAEVMSADDVWNDAQRLAALLNRNAAEDEQAIQLQIPLTAYLSALDNLDRDELLLLRDRVDERLAS